MCVTSTRNVACVTSRPTKRLPNRLPKYPVPERLKKCIVENKDVATIVPCLLKVSTVWPHCGVLSFLAKQCTVLFCVPCIFVW